MGTWFLATAFSETLAALFGKLAAIDIPEGTTLDFADGRRQIRAPVLDHDLDRRRASQCWRSWPGAAAAADDARGEITPRPTPPWNENGALGRRSCCIGRFAAIDQLPAVAATGLAPLADVLVEERQHLRVEIEVGVLVVEAVHLVGLQDDDLGRVARRLQRVAHRLGVLVGRAHILEASGEEHRHLDAGRRDTQASAGAAPARRAPSVRFR